MYCIHDLIVLSLSALLSSTAAPSAPPEPDVSAHPAHQVGVLAALETPALQQGPLGELLAPSQAFSAPALDDVDAPDDQARCCKTGDWQLRGLARHGGAFGRVEQLGHLEFRGYPTAGALLQERPHAGTGAGLSR